MTDDELAALIRRYGVTSKLRRAVERAYGWRGDDWYACWPMFGGRLERILSTKGETS